jgi:predicted phosphodiesterase
MKIRLLSDLHNEFCIFNIPQTLEDSSSTLVLAGDICVIEKPSSYIPFLEETCSRFEDVILVAGNHEFYGSCIHKVHNTFNSLGFKNFHYLNDSSFVKNGVAFIGATLWTDLKNNCPLVSWKVENSLNDYRNIRIGTDSEPYKYKLRAIHTVGLNKKSKDYIFKTFREYKKQGLKTVVVTHHGPSWQSIADIYKTDDVSYGFCNEYDYLIEENGPDYWLHGHTHDSFDYTIGETRIICNPRGYSNSSNGSENPLFNGSLFFEL